MNQTWTCAYIFRIQQNCTVLESRLRKITESKNNLEESIKEKAATNRSLIVQINSRKPEIKTLSKRRDQLRRLVLHTTIYFPVNPMTAQVANITVYVCACACRVCT